MGEPKNKKKVSMGSKLPTIIDNRTENTLRNTLNRLLGQTKSWDIATGCFELGAFVCLGTNWANIERIRILMGGETTRASKEILLEAIRNRGSESIEEEKVMDDRLVGLAAVADAIRRKQIQPRVFTQAKFHAKAYIHDTNEDGLVDCAIVGSSNFTRLGLTENVELNLATKDELHIIKLKEWYEHFWQQGEDISAEVLEVITPHLREYDPFTIYLKSLHDFFAGKEKPQDDWEVNDSVIYKMLAKYQRDGYHQALQIAGKWGGALICDGVGLGKTFIGLMILERCIKEKREVLLVVPKAAEKSVWQSNIDRYLKPSYRREYGKLVRICRHTDFGREGTINAVDIEDYKKDKEIIIIDEAHHFRNPNSNRGEMLMSLTEGKTVYMMTATPINNKIDDLYNLINYFARDRQDHFAELRVQNLRRHFLNHEKRLKEEESRGTVAEAVQQEDLLRTDDLLKRILIQRSRRYVKESEIMESQQTLFPLRQPPRVIPYSLKSVYAGIYTDLNEAFNREKPFLNLAIYILSRYSTNPDSKKLQSQTQINGLIRTMLLKRLESSFKAFESTIESLLVNMATVLKRVDKKAFESWEKTNPQWWKLAYAHVDERMSRREEDEEEEELPIVEEIENLDPKKRQVLIEDIVMDMNQLAKILSKVYRHFYLKDHPGEIVDPAKDEKVQQLLKYLQNDPLINGRKVLIFTEFKDTARYIAQQLENAGLNRVEQVDSGRNVNNREDIIKRFAPYYNCFNSAKELNSAKASSIDILISTDVPSEGLNLQVASLLINYDLHWNPVRLMQRIGRLDRRLNPDIEKEISRPPELNGKVYFWNFLPPDELDDLLGLWKKLKGKILRINRLLGIEGALLKPDDPQMSLIEFNEDFEGKQSIEELMNLEAQRLQLAHPELWKTLPTLPRRLFSGKYAGVGFEPVVNRDGLRVDQIVKSKAKGLFCCYRMPPVLAKAAETLFDIRHENYDKEKHGEGEIKWYFWNAETGEIKEKLEEVWSTIRCKAVTPRNVVSGVDGLVSARKAIEKHIKNSYLRDIQAPLGTKPTLIAWMEIN